MILIVESGATKTDWCLVDAGKPVSRLQTPGMNLSTIAAEANAAVFADAVDTFTGVDEVHFYAAGLLEFPTVLDRVFCTFAGFGVYWLVCHSEGKRP